MKKTIVCMLLILTLLVSAFPPAISASESGTAKTAADPTKIVSISAGSTMSAAVRADGSLWTWGCNQLSQSGATWGNYWSFDVRSQSLGIASGEHVPSTPILAFSENAKSVICGHQTTGSDTHSYYLPITAALKADNSLWLWGGGRYGVLGNGNDYGSSWKPTKVLDNVVSYDVSGYHSAAVTSDGSLYMWGRNGLGQIGNGTTDNVLTPTKNENIDNVASVALGNFFTAALKKDGSLWTWGANNYGQLGIGSADGDAHATPVKVLDNVESFAVGDQFCLALKADGSLWCWGCNTYGELGLGNTNNQYSPVLNENFDNDIVSIEAGYAYSAAILTNGDLYMWGMNGSGKLGDGSSDSKSRPHRIMKKVAQVALGEDHTLALKTDGTLWAWGNNSAGQLGDRTTEHKTFPVEITLGRINASFQGDNMSTAKTLDIPWDDTYLYDSTTAYNKDMAISGIVLSEAAYSNTNVFKQFGYTYAGSGSSNAIRPAFHVYYKVLWDFDSPHVQIMMSIRGTKNDFSQGALFDIYDDEMTDIRSVTDCFQGASDSLLNSLQTAENNIISNLKKQNISISLTKRNTKYFLTGHSLGAACANKVAISLVEDGLAFPNNVYAYTYATPHCINDYDQILTVPRMFNIINEWDVTVPNLPTVVFDSDVKIIPLHPGRDRYYMPYDTNTKFMSSLYQLYGEYPDNRYKAVKAHMTPVYLAALLSTESKSSVNKIFSRARVVSAHCPVDIAVYDPDGNLCARTEGSEIHYETNCPVIITIVGDEKYVQIPDDREYTIQYTGTDTGKMKVEDQIYSLESGVIEYEKVFENVDLKSGKLLAGNIDGTDDTENTDLNVVDEEGDPVSAVNESGQETLLGKYDLDEADVILPTGSFRYSGEAIEPLAGVTDLTEGADYRVIYKNNTYTGTATVVVKGINDYRGRYTSTFNIYGNGDADGNGVIESIDTAFIQRYIAQEETPYAREQLINGDVDSSGELELIDVTAIQYYLAQLTTPYPIGIES